MRSYLPLICVLVFSSCYKDHQITKSEQPPASPEAQGLAASPSYRGFTSYEVQSWDSITDLANDQPMIVPELQTTFCLHVYRLPLKANFDDLLGVLCENKKPTETFDKIDRYAGRVGSNPRAAKINLAHEPDGFTKGTYIVAYRVPIQPKWVRTAAVPQYMVATSQYDYALLSGTILEDLNATLGGDLQFSKVRMQARMDITTPDGHSFSNQRNTEINGFQVVGGNAAMGIGSEHLIDKNNPDFKDYRTMTLMISNTDYSATLITVITLHIRNNGFPEVAERVFSDITTSQAIQVRDGLMAELAAGNFNPERQASLEAP